MNFQNYISNSYFKIPGLKDYDYPWEVISNLDILLKKIISIVPKNEFRVKNGIAIHNEAVIEKNVTINNLAIIGKNSIIKSGAYIRNGAFIGNGVTIGTNSEIKQSIIFDTSRIAHLNYVGNSMIGEDVNLEAGSVLANHLNEFNNKQIEVIINGSKLNTNMTKFGSFIGDGSRIGANAVLNPGTILQKNSVVGRLDHVDQVRDHLSK